MYSSKTRCGSQGDCMQAIDFAYIVKATSPQGSSDCSCNSGHGTPAALGVYWTLEEANHAAMQEYLSRAQPNCESFLWVLDASSWHNLELMNENGGHERGRDLEQEDVVVPPSAHHPCHSPEVMQVMYLPEESWSDALMCDISLETSADGRDGGQFPAYPRFSEADYHEEGMFRSPLVWVEQQSLIADHLLQGNARKSVHMEKIARFMEEVVCSLQDVVQELTRADADKDGIRAFWESITLMKCKNSPAKNG